MSRIACRCGNLIPTNHDNLTAYRGSLLPEAQLENWSTAELQQLAAFIKVIKSGGSIADFAAPGTSEEVATALLTWKISGEAFFELSREVYQCSACGRLLLETSRRNEFRAFLPESADSHDIFRGLPGAEV